MDNRAREFLISKQMAWDDKLMEKMGLYHKWKDKNELSWLFSAFVYSKAIGDDHMSEEFYLGDGLYIQIENFPKRQFQEMYHIKITNEDGVLELESESKEMLKEIIQEEAFEKLEDFFNQYRVRLLFEYHKIEDFIKEISGA